MRPILSVAIVAFANALSWAATADVGPPPTCPPGTYHAYMYGHKCVPNGSHLERDPNGGGVIIVKDGALGPKPATSTPKVRFTADPPDPVSGSPDPAPAASASATAPANSATAAPVNSVAPAPTVSAAPTASAVPSAAPPANAAATPPPPQRGCTCGVPEAPEERVGFVLVIGSAFFAWSRRKRLERFER